MRELKQNVVFKCKQQNETNKMRK